MNKDKIVKQFIKDLKSKFFIDKDELFEDYILMISHSDLYKMIQRFEELYNKGGENNDRD